MSPTTRMICDYRTGDAIRPATPAECAAYDATLPTLGAEGVIEGGELAADLDGRTVWLDGAPGPTSLVALRDALVAGASWHGAPIAHGAIDWTSLPTYGGAEPTDTTGVWSWDATHLLVGSCADDLAIVERPEVALRRTIDASGLSIAEWARTVAAGRDPRTVERWLAGEPIPESAQRWLERLVAVDVRGGDVVTTVAR